MHRVIVIAASGLALAACSSAAPNLDFLSSSAAVTTELRLESEPPGAEAKTSQGSACRTPCTLEVNASQQFSVTFALEGYTPQTIDVVPRVPEFTPRDSEVPPPPAVELSPNPAFVQLEPAPPPEPARRRGSGRPRG
jgi:hypothetical protein